MIGKHEIAEAMRNSDAISEEHDDMFRYWSERGVAIEDLTYCAMQHGLRVVMVHKGQNPNTVIQPTMIALNRDDQRAQIEAAGSWMSGFAVAERLFRSRDGEVE